MGLAVLTAIAGGGIGWGIATGNPWPIAVVGLIVLLVAFMSRARLADRRVGRTAAPALTTTGWEDVHRELARARRHERPLAIVRLPGASGTDAAARSAAIAPYLRRIDRTWSEHGDVNVLLPEADRAAAEILVERLRKRQPEAVGGANIATFPADGLTSGALLAALYGTPMVSVPVPKGVGRPLDLPADVIELRPHLVPDPTLTDRRESSS
ncbi:MAG: hypothetical protein QOF11_1338 [Chloroflexota bacterium]|jgi:hypothetical protein|nr:hypothetical protein [Chloroflexota bacterium]